MELDYIKLLFIIVTTIVTVAITFYLKDFLQAKMEHKELRKKLEAVVGRNAYIVYAGVGSSLYKITDIDSDGVTIKNSLQTIFIPPKLLLNSAMIVPDEDYEKTKQAQQAKEIERASEIMFQPLFDKMIEGIESDIQNGSSELSSRIEIRVIQILEDKGVLSQVSTAELNRLKQLGQS